MNFKLTIQYDGTDFHGWQKQGELRTVQSELSASLSLIDGNEVTVHGSGRTDAGVHAEGQVASVRLRHEFTPEKLRAAINGNLAPDVRITEVEQVPDDFHARYSASGKNYKYRVVQDSVVSPFWFRFAHHDARPLDLALMRGCAARLVGTHDWTAFSAAQSDAQSRVRTITNIDILGQWDERTRTRLLEISVTADGFLRYMVRSIAGALLAAGRGEIDEAAIVNALSTGERILAAATAPAKGLTLTKVYYDDQSTFAPRRDG